MRTLVFLFTVIPCICFSQQTEWQIIDSIFSSEKRAFYDIRSLAQFIDLQFDTEQAKIAAIYWWTATNIQYKKTAIQTDESYSQAKVTSEAFRTQKSMCEGYAGVFNSLCNLAGIQSYIISGYTAPNNEIDYTAHAWNAAKIGNNYFLFDPTWGSGVLFENTFIQRFNDKYFMVTPEKMIRSHMPFDPIWQFLSFPVSHQQFTIRDFENTCYKEQYHVSDSIQFFILASRLEQAKIELRRIKQTNTTNPALQTRKQYLKNFIHVWIYNQDVNTLNKSISYYNQAVESYNAYLQTKHPDDLQKHLLDAKSHYKKAIIRMKNFDPQDAEHRQGKQRLLKLMRELEQALNNAN